MEATLKFYDDKKKIILPDEYENFLNKLSQILQIQKEMINNLQIFYKDDEGDKILIKSFLDYNQFLIQLKENQVSILEIQLEKEDNEFKERIMESFTKFTIGEDIINPSLINSNSENIENNNNNKIDKPVINNIEKGKNNIQNDSENKIHQQKPQLIQPLPILNQNNIISQNLNYSNNQNINSNNINNINNNNNFINQNYYQIQQNQNNNNINIFNNNKVIFNISCTICGKHPLQSIIYKCQECSIFFCEECEIIHGPIHPHAFLKIRTNEQLNKWNKISSHGESKIGQVFGDVKQQFMGGLKKVSNYFNKDHKNNNQNINYQNNNMIQNNQNYYNNNYLNQNINQISINNPNNSSNFQNYQHFQNNNLYNPNSNNPSINNNVQFQNMPNNNIKNLIQIARNSFDLRNISDQQLEIALKKTNGNIELAVVELTNNLK